ncbi:uncharacterized protein LOC117644082 isoform X2 [Thrips palmi]|uniref:Uncharacterized protein LOC117644082 isoform X2 n=1 Tax=Thrips palmi TaxID=161013 RepID=A0A6P8ZLN5_THRPL|nr:uncharacterized protein LOC117644082 isoform X2 [Thrips palmi]
MSANDAHDGGLQDGEPPGVLSLLAIAASMLLCWIFYRVRMRQCEMVLAEMAKALEEVRRSAEALQTRRSIVRATTAFAEKALTEYKTLLNMLDEMQAGDCRKANLPNLRHEIEMETMRAQVNMVQGCLLAMSQEALNLQALSAGEEKQEDIVSSLHHQRKSYTHMSEELLSLLERKSSENIKLFSSGGPEKSRTQKMIWHNSFTSH